MEKKMQKLDGVVVSFGSTLLLLVIVMAWAVHQATTGIERIIQRDNFRQVQRYAAEEWNVRETRATTPRAAAQAWNDHQRRQQWDQHLNTSGYEG